MDRLRKTLGQLPPLLAVFLLLLVKLILSLLSGRIGGMGGQVLSCFSYLLPILLYILLFMQPTEAAAMRPTAAGLRRALPLWPLFLAAVMLTSTLTGWLMARFSLPVTGGSISEGTFPLLLLKHTLLPVLLEEGLCRLAIFMLIARASRQQAVWQSALLFALLHANLYQLPYAFVGGLFLALAVYVGGSPLYAALFHFSNNLLSLCLQLCARELGQAAGLYASLATGFVLFLLSGLSLYFMLKKWRGAAFFRQSRGWFFALCRSPLLFYMALMLLYTFL